MNIDTVIAIVAAVGGLSGLVSAISTAVFKILEYRKAQKGETFDAKLKPIMDKLEQQEKALHEIRLDTLRTQLYIKMEHEPHNHDTILTIAHKYFVDYKGDWVATTDFQAWADREKIKIPTAIMNAIARNESK